MATDTTKVSAVVLAYGNRGSLLARVLAALCREGLGRIVVVANAVGESTNRIIESFSAAHPGLVRVVVSRNNLGSAGGYALGMQVALEEDCRYAWLLDDDNEPAQGCLDALLASYANIGNNTRVALAAMRPAMPEMKQWLHGNIQSWPRPGTFIGFHLANMFVRGKSTDKRGHSPRELLWSAYGGLLIPRELIEAIGFPDDRLFIYGDDFEWTSRIPRKGGRLLLVPDAVVEDLDTVWNAAGGKHSNLVRRILYLGEARVYYEVRNRVYLGRALYPGGPLAYSIHRSLFLAAAWFIASMRGRLDRYRLIYKAVRDGEAGRLGPLGETGDR